MNTPSPGTAIVTGASSGIGKVYAERLASRGYDLLLVARRIDRLDALASEIQATTGRSVSALKADLSLREDVAKLETMLAEDQSVTLLVNNAGISLEGSILENDAATIEKLLAINTTAPTLLTAAAAKAFVARNKGGIINVASVLAYAPEMMDGIYSGTKAHMVNVTLGLASKLKGTNVRVQVVLPGATRTDIWDQTGINPDEVMPGKVMEVADLVDAGLVGYDQGEVVTIPSLHDAGQFEALEKARAVMGPNLSNKDVAERYRV